MSDRPPLLRVRTVSFSNDVIAFCQTVRQTAVTKPLIEQLVRSATSIGANYAEADNAASRNDFRNKIFIAKKETAETKYWLSLLSNVVEDRTICEKLAQECHYLLMTFQKIINTLHNGSRSTDEVRRTANG